MEQDIFYISLKPYILCNYAFALYDLTVIFSHELAQEKNIEVEIRNFSSKEFIMRVRLPNWISCLENYDQGIVFYGYRQRYGLCYARDYMYPEITAQNAEFGSQGQAVTATTWNAASEGFKANMQTYADAWNATQQPGREPIRDMSALNLFVRGCFATAKLSAFDLSTLTVDNFGGEAGDLLGTAAPDVGHLIEAAGMPACGLDLSTLDSSIETV